MKLSTIESLRFKDINLTKDRSTVEPIEDRIASKLAPDLIRANSIADLNPGIYANLLQIGLSSAESVSAPPKISEFESDLLPENDRLKNMQALK